MTIWFTSDCHFAHRNILKYCPNSRPFDTVESMNETLIFAWNASVAESDCVVVVGDFFFGGTDVIDDILPRLNGNIFLVCGNHDYAKKIKHFEKYGVNNLGYRKIIYADSNWDILACHYPPNDPHAEQAVRDYVNHDKLCVWVYGHVHDQAPHGLHYINGILCYHVGVDTNFLTPVSMKEILGEGF